MQKGSTRKNLERKDSFRYVLIIEGTIIGIIVGFVISEFRIALANADLWRNELLEIANQQNHIFFIIAIALVFIAFLIAKIVNFEPYCKGSGIPQVEGELKGKLETKWYRVILTKLLGGFLALGSGLSLGREGPSIQLGAMVAKGFSRINHRLLTEERMLITCGAGAGLAAAFGAPLAGAIFSLEELHKNFSTEVLLTTMSAAISADFVVKNIIGLKPVFSFQFLHPLPLNLYWAIILFGIILGVLGVFYNNVIAFMQDLFDKINKPFFRIMILYCFVLVFAITAPLLLGSGHGLVAKIAHNEFSLILLIVFLVIKFLFSTMSFSCGVPGGIFLPLLVLGALIGGIYGKILLPMVNADMTFLISFVILGMAGYFSSIVRAPITGVILITEMTGDFTNLLALSVVALVAYVIADLLKGLPIYDQLLERMIRNADDKVILKEAKRKVIIDAEVYLGSYIDGKKIKDINLPKGTLIVAVIRDNEEFIPNGQSVLCGGDSLSLLCDAQNIIQTEHIITKLCNTIYCS